MSRDNEYFRKYREKNREHIRAYQKQHYINKPWAKVMTYINVRCNCSSAKYYYRYGGRGIKNLLTMEELKNLWLIEGADKMKNPSIDRRDNDGHYTHENCRFMERGDNSSRSSSKPVTQMFNGIKIKTFKSLTEACKQTGVSVGNISSCVTGKTKTAGGFIWKNAKNVK